ncbi:tetratricopeptide repeat protein [Nonlabens ponticola]|uniref:Tetratricopeptide repeat protein n=1 Tax=Nonlabens ponticola TaxID=2496866 RepID=A0A3S9MUL9_9FLAO|nr:tetratricopeptide repeat protein [Nonlabens ponticola]AZQ42868.1 tetratricopeptide repeat protein [Nonlabens ponticola]
MKMLFLFTALIFCYSVSGQSAFAKAEQLSQQSNYKQAIPLYKEALQAAPKDAKILMATGKAYGELKQFEEASEVYKKLLAIDESIADYHFYYGGSLGLYAKNSSKLKALGMLDDVKFHLKKAAELDENHIETRWALVQMYCELPGIVGGSVAISREYAAELAKISPVDGYLATGWIEIYEENYKEAEVALKKAVEIGNSPTTYLKLAELYSKHMDRDDLAIKTLQKADSQSDDKRINVALKRLKSKN